MSIFLSLLHIIQYRGDKPIGGKATLIVQKRRNRRVRIQKRSGLALCNARCESAAMTVGAKNGCRKSR